MESSSSSSGRARPSRTATWNLSTDLKQEYIWPHDFANYQEAEAVIAEAFRDYNQVRLHSALKYVPPEDLHASWKAEHK